MRRGSDYLRESGSQLSAVAKSIERNAEGDVVGVAVGAVGAGLEPQATRNGKSRRTE